MKLLTTRIVIPALVLPLALFSGAWLSFAALDDRHLGDSWAPLPSERSALRGLGTLNADLTCTGAPGGCKSSPINLLAPTTLLATRVLISTLNLGQDRRLVDFERCRAQELAIAKPRPAAIPTGAQIDGRQRLARLLQPALFGLTASQPGTLALAGNQATGTPRRVSLGGLRSWIISGAWDRHGALMLPDVLGHVLTYDPRGNLLTGSPASYNSMSGTSPSSMVRTDKGLLVKHHDGHLVLLDDQHTPLASSPLVDSRDATGVRSLFNVTSVGDYVLSFSDVKSLDGKWSSGFIVKPFSDASDYDLVYSVDPSDPMRTFYLLGNPYVAALHGNGYFIAMEETPRIFEVSPRTGRSKVRRLDTSPFSPEPVKPISRRMTRDTMVDVYQEVEASTMPVGLYSAGDYLYVLTRELIREGGSHVTWRLTKIDPRSDVVLGDVVLQTQASHLTVVPGPDYWAVIEKGPVTGLAEQKVESIWIIPRDWIEHAILSPSLEIRQLAQGVTVQRESFRLL